MSTVEITAETLLPQGRTNSPEEFVRIIEALLDSEQFAAARQLASRAAELFADHPWLRKANRVLNPREVVSRPAPAALSREPEFAWLRQHGIEYRGQWVALVGDGLVAHSESIEEVLREVRDRGIERPLLHRVD